jgi:hypothetical protein
LETELPELLPVNIRIECLMLSAILTPSLVANPHIVTLSSELECRCTGVLINDPTIG